MIGTDVLVRQRQDVTVLRAVRTPVTSWLALPGLPEGDVSGRTGHPQDYRGIESVDDTDRLQQHAV
jgi:hypothetical protein